MAPTSTFLAPGQRYAPSGVPTWNLEPQVIVLKVYLGPDGSYRIAHLGLAGQILQTSASELEAKVEAGVLVPVAGAGRTGKC